MNSSQNNLNAEQYSQQVLELSSLFSDKDQINVAFLIYDQVEALDLNGPIDVFVKANFLNGRYNLYTVSPDESMVSSEAGLLKMKATYTIADAPQADVLIIPGAYPEILMAFLNSNPQVTQWISAQHQKTSLTASVCTGAFFLSAAGILDGKKATTHYMALEALEGNPTIEVIKDQRFIVDGKVLTTAGISSGIDGALHIIEAIEGEHTANEIARLLVYNRNQDISLTQS